MEIPFFRLLFDLTNKENGGIYNEKVPSYINYIDNYVKRVQ